MTFSLQLPSSMLKLPNNKGEGRESIKRGGKLINFFLLKRGGGGGLIEDDQNSDLMFFSSLWFVGTRRHVCLSNFSERKRLINSFRSSNKVVPFTSPDIDKRFSYVNNWKVERTIQ